ASTAAAPSLFGATPAASAGAAPSLFGRPAASTSATPSLFGATPATSAPSLFGAAPAPAGSTFSLFGSKPAVTATSAPSLFGATPAASQPAFSLGQPASSAQGLSLFGGAAPSTTAPGFSFSGGLTTVPLGQQTAPGQTAAGPFAGISLKTRYTELQEPVRKQLDEMENFIQQQLRVAESVANNNGADLLESITTEVKQTSQKMAGLQNLLKRDKYLCDDLRQQVGLALKNSDLVMRFIERYRTGAHQSGAPPKYDPYMAYFFNVADSLEKRMQQYRQSIEELELNIKSMSEQKEYSPQVILEVMRYQDDGFLATANKVAALHDDLEKLREKYLDFRRMYFGVDESKRFGT
ncbi:hypothetical protein BC832DRAFT_524895, partial [Gaertneriomyces semiglobifer]